MLYHPNLRNFAFGALASLAGFFPHRGDVIEVVHTFRPLTRRVHLDPKRMWLEDETRWLVLSCAWEVVGTDGFFPATQGVMVLTSYGISGDGMLELFWRPGEPGARGFLQPGSTGDLYRPRYMRRLIKARHMTNVP